MSTNIFLQARVNSTRFPKKVLKEICGKSVFELIIDRIKLVRDINKIILVTGPPQLNTELVNIAKKQNIEYFCGSEENILDRLYQASKKYFSDNIIRITCDNPLLDYDKINKNLEFFLREKFDLLYIDETSFPKGMNFEIILQSALEETWQSYFSKFSNKDDFDKTFHSPGTCFLENSNLKKIAISTNNIYPNLRLTMDHFEDFQLIKNIYEEIYPKKPNFRLDDILELLSKKPELAKINEIHQHPSMDNNIS